MKALVTSPEVVRVIDLRTQHIGPDELLVAAKVEFSATLTAPELSNAINSVESSIREKVPLAGRIYLEPDVWTAEHVPTPDSPVSDSGDGTH
jgi:divalent metal cation (Fe/Co/Zn/Cd) transporter